MQFSHSRLNLLSLWQPIHYVHSLQGKGNFRAVDFPTGLVRLIRIRNIHSTVYNDWSHSTPYTIYEVHEQDLQVSNVQAGSSMVSHSPARLQNSSIVPRVGNSILVPNPNPILAM